MYCRSIGIVAFKVFFMTIKKIRKIKKRSLKAKKESMKGIF